jgi:quinone-modifying oxidoreductase subunit QmoC
MGLYFNDGLVAGFKKGWQMRHVALGLLNARRLNSIELLRGHRCRDTKGIAAMLEKAKQIEARRAQAPR